MTLRNYLLVTNPALDQTISNGTQNKTGLLKALDSYKKFSFQNHICNLS